MFAARSVLRSSSQLKVKVIRRDLNSKIPKEPVVPPFERLKKRPKIEIDAKTIELLERNSLVNFSSEEAVTRLEEAIAFAEPIKEVDTSGVQPMYSVLDDLALRLREDEVTDGNLRREVLANAAKTEEDYFVAPPGNIPMKTTDSKRLQKVEDKKKL